MKFGLSLTGMLQQPPGTDMVAAVEEALGLVSLAKELGFSFLYAGQHFLSHPYQMLQPLPVMARLVAAAPGMDLVTTAVLPLANPVDVAEQVATLDVITGGHAILATALGYRNEETDAFGIARRDRVSRMVEALEVINLLWHGEGPVTYEGRHFQLHDAPTGLRPVQRPGPPVWIAASSDNAVKRTGRLGYPWLINHADYPTIERQVALYRDARAQAGHPTQLPSPSCESSLSPTRRRRPCAHRATLRLRQVRNLRAMGSGPGPQGRTVLRLGVCRPRPKDRFIVGNVEQVVADLKRYEALGITHIGLRMRWAGMPPEPTADAMRLTAEQVFPLLPVSRPAHYP